MADSLSREEFLQRLLARDIKLPRPEQPPLGVWFDAPYSFKAWKTPVEALSATLFACGLWMISAPSWATALVSAIALIIFARALGEVPKWRRSTVDRMEGTPSDSHQLVRISLHRMNDSIVWTDIGGLVIERDCLIFASPATAFLIGGQDIACTHRLRDGFEISAEGERFLLTVDLTGFRVDETATRSAFKETLRDFLAHHPPTNRPRQLPPIHEYRPAKPNTVQA